LQLSIVIPVHNEEENIRSLANEIRAHLEKHIKFELIYVDDGSKDDSVAELMTLKNEGFEQLRILRHDGCFGQSASVLTGIRNARANWVVTLDGDGQNDPVDILPIYHALLSAHEKDARYQCAAGYRKKRNDSTSKRWSSLIANRIRASLLHDDTPDTGCGLKAMQRSAFLALPFFDHVHVLFPH
jgi:dolichol-phosphate mannosyltransferase